MSSINTNSSAMVALQTLKGINSNLAKTQSEISTGKTVASAKDNSAIWAISKVMESDVAGFETVSTNLATGQSMVSVARTATESIANDLKSIKQKVVAALDPSADSGKLQDEVDALVSMIGSKVSGAQFNGVNLINNTDTRDIVASLDRSGDKVTANTVTVTGVDLGMVSTAATGTVAAGSVAGASVTTDGKNATQTIAADAQGSFKLDGLVANDTVSVSLGSKTFSYTVTAEDALSNASDIAATKLRDQINAAGMTGVSALYDSGKPGEIIIDNKNAIGDKDAAGNVIAASTLPNLNMGVSLNGAGSGDLNKLTGFDVAGPSALADIEAMIKTTVDAAASFGAVESRLESQASFVEDLTKAMKSGIGSLVDADMEEASARLQALQTQQQLGIQALSIANQQPQSILSLFK